MRRQTFTLLSKWNCVVEHWRVISSNEKANQKSFPLRECEPPHNLNISRKTLLLLFIFPSKIISISSSLNSVSSGESREHSSGSDCGTLRHQSRPGCEGRSLGIRWMTANDCLTADTSVCVPILLADWSSHSMIFWRLNNNNSILPLQWGQAQRKIKPSSW